MEDVQVNPEVVAETIVQPVEEVQAVVDEQPAVQAEACESCNVVTELFDVPHHQVGNPKVWRYCKRCKMAHDLEMATNAKLKEIQAMNPAAVNDPAFVGQVRETLTKEMTQNA
jgi:hypothetical protein